MPYKTPTLFPSFNSYHPPFPFKKKKYHPPFPFSHLSSPSPPPLPLPALFNLLTPATPALPSLQTGVPPELANPAFTLPTTLEEPQEERNKWVVRALYEALNSRDVDTVTRLLAPDIEWRFHGPPARQHMMRLLTGHEESFYFLPLSIAAFEDIVLVEGTDRRGSVFWVHAWTVGADGIVTQVREYFNTSLTVTRLSNSATSAPSSSSSSSSSRCCEHLWESRYAGGGSGKSVPGLVLAI